MNYKAALLAIVLITPLSGCMDMENMWDFGNSDGCIDVDDPAYNPEFDNSDWSGKDLSGDNLSNAPMDDFNLMDAVLIDTNLSGACLNGADLTGADLTGADLTGAHMEKTRATFLVGDCPASLPTYWKCVGNNLVGPDADLGGADLGGADLRYADLSGTNLVSANLDGANLSGGFLDNADLTGVDLRYADLKSVHARNLLGCPAALPTDWQCIENTLVGPYAGLTGAILSGADL
ncbi:uncharacterized protein METZ01_LOCUS258061, partial [marine metagenome]